MTPQEPQYKGGEMKHCKGCGIPKYPMWYSEEYCSRSCALQKLRELKNEYQELLRELLVAVK